MPKGLVFWVMMLIWLVLGIIWRAEMPAGKFGVSGSIMTFILFFLLGWAVFGFAIQ